VRVQPDSNPMLSCTAAQPPGTEIQDTRSRPQHTNIQGYFVLFMATKMCWFNGVCVGVGQGATDTPCIVGPASRDSRGALGLQPSTAIFRRHRGAHVRTHRSLESWRARSAGVICQRRGRAGAHAAETLPDSAGERCSSGARLMSNASRFDVKKMRNSNLFLLSDHDFEHCSGPFDCWRGCCFTPVEPKKTSLPLSLC
jgi:hypothetical protein